MVRTSFFLLMLTLTLSAAEPTNNATAAVSTNRQVFQVKGVVVGLEPGSRAVRIKHETIPGYMPAMTMPFDVKDTNELAGLAAGDAVTFRMTVTEDDGWIDRIQKREAPAVNMPANSGITITRDVDPLHEGDPVPDYAFTNELGKRIHVWQFKGRALAINFLFTRCPYPTFCPLSAKKFTDVQKKMLARKDGPTNWQLLTISFDPEFDQPVILRSYAATYGYDPAHWSFATGKLSDIAEFGDLFGLQFWREPDGSMNHNLRTVVVDSAGRLQKIFIGNEWAADEAVQELVKAAEMK